MGAKRRTNDERHLASLVPVRGDERDPHHVVTTPTNLAFKPTAARKVEHRDIGVEIVRDEIEPERPMMETEGRDALSLGHLVVKELHDVFFAPELIIDAERSENPAQQNPGSARSRLHRHSPHPLNRALGEKVGLSNPFVGRGKKP